MDTPAPPAEPPYPLADEIRHSALLLGGALGLMGFVAVVLLLLTTTVGG